MPEIKITENWVAFIVSIIVLIGGIYNGVSWLTEDLANKSDIAELKNSIELLRVDSSIALIKLYLKDLDGLEELTSEQRREKRILEKKLQEFELKKLAGVG